MQAPIVQGLPLTYAHSYVWLLADAFEHYKNTCRTYYRSYHADSVTAPSLAWDARLEGNY